MSDTQVSAWQTPNELLVSMETPALVQRNQLLNQEAQQTINANEMEQISRASNWVISQDPENKDPAKQAQAYGAAVRLLRANNFAMKAPDQYPGFDAMQMMARQGTPSEKQAEWGFNLAANKAYSNATTPGATAPGAGGGGETTASSQLPIPARGTGGPGSSAEMPPELLPAFREAAQTYNIPMELLIAQARQESGFRMIPGGSGEIGIMQIMPKTARGMGLDPASLNDPRANILAGARYLRERAGADADMNDPAVQARALAAYNGGGDPQYVAHVNRYRPGFSPTDPAAAVTTYAAAPPAAAPGGGVAARYPGAVNAAGPAVGTAPAATTVPVVAAPSAAAAAAPTAPQNQVMPGQPNGPAATPPPAAVPPTRATPATAPPAPAGGPQPPQLPPLNNRGLTDMQQRQINAMQADPRVTLQQRMVAEQGFVNQNIQLGQKAFGDWIQLQQLQTSQGQLTVAQQNSALEAWKALHPDAKVTLTGGEIITQDPRSGAEIAPRIKVTPNEAPRFHEGAGIFENGAWRLPKPGEQGTPGSWAMGPSGQIFLPAATRPGSSSYTQQAEAYKTDIPVVHAASTAGQAAQNSLIQLNELAGLVGDGKLSTGPEGPFRSRVAAYMEQHGFSPDVIKSWTGMGSGSDAQLLQKLATATVGANAKADLGSNVGIQSLQLYQDANPGITMLDDANKRVTNMIRVSRALTDDYTTGLQTHFNSNQDSFLHDKGYNEPVSVYNAKWQQQNNPQVGAAAIGILNGDDYSHWAGRLASPDEAFRAAQLVARIDPKAIVQTASGPKPVKDILAHRDAP